MKILLILEHIKDSGDSRHLCILDNLELISITRSVVMAE